MSTEKKVLGWRVRSGHQEAATSTATGYEWVSGHRNGTLFESRDVAKMIVRDGFGGHRKLIRIVAKGKKHEEPGQPWIGDFYIEERQARNQWRSGCWQGSTFEQALREAKKRAIQTGRSHRIVAYT